jgi:hypothetical protein
MFERVGDPAIDAIGTSMPPWWVVVLAAFAVAVCTIVIVQGNQDDRGSWGARLAMVLILALGGWWLFDQLGRQERAAERRALDWRHFELATRALAPGSALGCLDAIAGEAVEDACENAVFASPEATAAAVAYVAAQLSLLADARDRGERATDGAATAAVRRAVEADRFGIVAHLLATRAGCTVDRCAAYFLLHDANQVRANLAERAFEASVKSHMASWPAAGSHPLAAATPASSADAGAVAAARPPNHLYFPSASSIPPVNIMTTEPPASPPRERAGGAAEATPPPKPSGSAPPRAQPLPGSAAAGSAPLQLTPGAR